VPVLGLKLKFALLNITVSLYTSGFCWPTTRNEIGDMLFGSKTLKPTGKPLNVFEIVMLPLGGGIKVLVNTTPSVGYVGSISNVPSPLSITSTDTLKTVPSVCQLIPPVGFSTIV
jgi:hypothetical protein